MNKVLITSFLVLFGFFCNISWATTNGTRDCSINALGTTGSGCEYPQVGALVYPFEQFGLEASAMACTGTIISNDDEKAVVLTARHCVVGLGFPANSIKLSFDSQVIDDVNLVIDSAGTSYKWDSISPCNVGESSCRLVKGDAVLMPLVFSNFSGLNSISNDLAFIVIDNNVNDGESTYTNQLEKLHSIWPDIPKGFLVNLPAVDQIKSLTNKERSAFDIVSVGYGVERPFIFSPPHYGGGMIGNAGFRAVIYPNIVNINETSLKTTWLENKEQEGLCNGDSGASTFLLGDGLPTLVSVHTLSGGEGNALCRTSGWQSRADRADTLKFLSCGFVGGDSEAVQNCVNANFGL